MVVSQGGSPQQQHQQQLVLACLLSVEVFHSILTAVFATEVIIRHEGNVVPATRRKYIHENDNSTISNGIYKLFKQSVLEGKG